MEVKERLPLTSAEPKRICHRRAALLLPKCHSNSCEPTQQVIKQCWLSGPQIFSSACSLLYISVWVQANQMYWLVQVKWGNRTLLKKKKIHASFSLSEQDCAQIIFPSMQNKIMVHQAMEGIASIMGCMPAEGMYCGPRSWNWATWCTYRL